MIKLCLTFSMLMDTSPPTKSPFMGFIVQHFPSLNTYSRPSLAIKKLKQPNNLEQYQSTFASKIPLRQDMDGNDITTSITDFHTASSYIETFSNQLCQNIYDSLDETCGKVDPAADRFLKQFWTDEMTSVFNLEQRYYKK